MSANGNLVQHFEKAFQPHEAGSLVFLKDNMTGAKYCECHIPASKLIAGATKRHYALADVTATDPLNAKALATGRHKSDESNYRGLGYRTDPRERGQMVELFGLHPVPQTPS
jgi:hypothetical protein